MFQGFNINLHNTNNKGAYASNAVGSFDITSVTTSGYEELTVAISVANNATAYEFFYREVGGGAWISDGQQAGLSRVISPLVESTNYEFYVTAIGPEDSRDSSVQQQTTLANPVPTTPVLDLATPNNSNSIFISWTTNGDETDNFTVQYKLNSSGVWLTFATVSSIDRSDTITGLSGNNYYDFRVIANNAYGTATSNVISQYTEVNAPTGLNITNVTASSLRLNWSTPSGGANSYTVRRNENGGAYAQVQNGLGGNFLDMSGLTRGSIEYGFIVDAVNTVSTNGSTALLYTIPEAPTAATGLSSSNIGKTSFQLSFSAGSNVEDYDIQTSPAGAGTWTTRVTGTTQTSNVIVSGLTQETNYDVRVISNGFISGETAISSTIPVTTIGLVTLRPTSDVSVSGWTTSPFFSKVNDQSDATFIVSGNNNGDTVTVRISNNTGNVITNPLLRVKVRKQTGGESATSFAATGTNNDFSQIVSISTNVSSTSFVELTATASGTIAVGGYLDIQLTRSGGGNPNNRRGIDCSEISIEF